MVNIQILLSRFKRVFRGWVKILVVFVVIAGLLFLISSLGRSSNNLSRGTEAQLANDGVTGALAEINKVFEFEAVNADREDITVKFTIVSAERKSEIKLKGEPRRPASGYSYLLVRMEIQNDKTERVAIAPADRIRLEIDGKLYAPDYHNGNVVIDPISVKKDIVAFAVKSDQKDFIFQIGELEGDKEKVEVKF